MVLPRSAEATPLRLVFLANIAFIAILELALAPWNASWDKVSAFLLLNFSLGAAAGFSGGLLGFIFGVPRTPESTNLLNRGSRVNTNLEQISDWLTKLLVGATLASLANLPSFAARFINFLNGHGYSGLPGAGTLAVFIMVYYLVLGFFWSYIETRSYIGKWLDGEDSPLDGTMRDWAALVYTKMQTGLPLAEALRAVISVPTTTALDPKYVASKLAGTPSPSIEDIRKAIAECMAQAAR